MCLKFFAAVAAAAVASAATQGAIVVDLDRVGTGTVNVGDVITARILARTDNINGIAVLNARITTAATAGGTALNPGSFIAIAQPQDGTASGTNEAVLTTFNPTLNTGGATTTLAPASVAFDTLTGQPTTATNNRPLTGFTGQGSSGRAGSYFYSPTTEYTYLADVVFRAIAPGTVFFSLTPNGPSGAEFSALTGTANSAVTPTTDADAGFSVTVVPEPASLAAVGLGVAMMLRRRRQA